MVVPARLAFLLTMCLRFVPMLARDAGEICWLQLRGARIGLRDLRNPRNWVEAARCLAVPLGAGWIPIPLLINRMLGMDREAAIWITLLKNGSAVVFGAIGGALAFLVAKRLRVAGFLLPHRESGQLFLCRSGGSFSERLEPARMAAVELTGFVLLALSALQIEEVLTAPGVPGGISTSNA